jgi:hypothetical protein
MTEPRKGRLIRTASKPESEARTASVVAGEARWTRESRPLIPPLKVGREWDRVRRIAYL